jgi:arabinan endo-1,5-alpha-L-arabinosidase
MFDEKQPAMKTVPRFLMLLALFPGIHACTDIVGDGMDTVIWEGSVLQEATSYRNPVWEPDLEKPSVIRGATQFYAFGSEKEWSPGLIYRVPVLRSTNLMEWDLAGEAFKEVPEWADGAVQSVSGIFSKTLGTYYMAYSIGDQGIGTAGSKTPQGPYTDYGKLIDQEISGFESLTEPFMIQSGLDFYLFFDTEEGVYGIELAMSRNSPPALNGEPFQVTGAEISGVHIHRKSSDSYYLFGTVGDEAQTEITIGRASNIEGPYLDQAGNDLLSTSGTLLVESDTESGFASPGHLGGIFTDKYDQDWIMYEVTDINKPELSSGAQRWPIMLSPIEWDAEGWPARVIKSTGGWNTPRFEF